MTATLWRLSGVETRKMIDTRAGVWLLGLIALIGAGLAAVLMVVGDPGEQTMSEYFTFAQLGVAVLLPILGILIVTSEWSQRTALTTFALQPRRGWVIAAKAAASVVLVVVTTAAMLGLAALANLITPLVTDAPGSFSVEAGLIGRTIVFQLAGVLVGFAFGLALLSSPLAIVLYFVLPTVWTVLGSVISALDSVAPWLDFSMTTAPLLEGSLDGEQWAQVGTSMAVWFVLPLVLGVIRVLRAEIK
ncbi:hypothetical protein [Haloactinopolyspora sp.]|uniref:hypothetical protein n=1 Tax=Haloactinopolyspora sp. TaxID=1966353 RepID=UPI00260B206B|nr:hypothetical protein [Haloactinopolyspora sp.]